MDSSIGYDVLSGNMHVDKQETTLFTLVSCDTSNTLSLICMFFLWKSTIIFNFHDFDSQDEIHEMFGVTYQKIQIIAHVMK